MASEEREAHREEMMEAGTLTEQEDEKAMSLDVGETCAARSREEDVREGDKNRELTVHTEGDRPQRLCAFPMSRIKSLMKFDPDLGLANPESVFLIARAAVSPHRGFIF